MGDTNIGWTNMTWNPVTGCSHVSPGCEHCYAETLSLRRGWSTKPWTAQNAAENVVLHPERLNQPLRWRTPRRVFVNSMSDLFHAPDSRAVVPPSTGVCFGTPRWLYDWLDARFRFTLDPCPLNDAAIWDGLERSWP